MIGILAVLVLAALGVAAFTIVNLDSTLDDAEASLVAAESQLSNTRSTLEGTESELSTTKTDLRQSERDRDQLEERVRNLVLDLRGVRGTLRKAEDRVELQSGQIDTLKTCLNGVSLALDAVIYLEYREAARALQAVESECNEAFALF